jgi:replicative DNA helicase
MLGTKGFAEMQAQDYSAARRKLARRPMYILDTYGMADLNDVRRCVYDAVTRHRVKYVVIDHVGFLRDSAADTEIASTSSVMRELKRWALDLQCHILVLAHLRKQKPGETKQAGIEDLRGSADLFQIADNVVLLNRSRGNSSMKARVLKCRDDSGKEGVAELSFNPATLRYSAT